MRFGAFLTFSDRLESGNDNNQGTPPERGSTADFKRFLNIAKGSCGELRSQLYIAKALEVTKSPEIEALLNECSEISSMIQELIKHLRGLLIK